MAVPRGPQEAVAAVGHSAKNVEAQLKGRDGSTSGQSSRPAWAAAQHL